MNYSRRNMLEIGAAIGAAGIAAKAAAATFGNPDEPSQGASDSVLSRTAG